MSSTPSVYLSHSSFQHLRITLDLRSSWCFFLFSFSFFHCLTHSLSNYLRHSKWKKWKETDKTAKLLSVWPRTRKVASWTASLQVKPAVADRVRPEKFDAFYLRGSQFPGRAMTEKPRKSNRKPSVLAKLATFCPSNSRNSGISPLSSSMYCQFCPRLSKIERFWTADCI